ncbi:unnamed protein product [Didymodactylos carnosus]|uniref:DZF domain-containing protein n=1 Tax=Didymodactylos carnosus TaxID=1234261 RepID=A0A813RC63_9BILA|nr:unnamed protein product [Didymodactylos carnosus]CAF3563583.1 unnamed protein product [Didymodactylos carnosus]
MAHNIPSHQVKQTVCIFLIVFTTIKNVIFPIDYDSALQIAAAALAKNTPGSQSSTPISSGKGAKWTYKGGAQNQRNNQQNSKKRYQPSSTNANAQIHYCEICRISCGGQQTYQEHLNGSKHKKKEQASKSNQELRNMSTKPGVNVLRCELCDVTCTAAEAYKAHIDGSKHQKALKLHQKLGKPIPSFEPQILNSNLSNSKPDIHATTPAVIQAKPKFIVKSPVITAQQQVIQPVNSEIVPVEQQQQPAQNNATSEDNNSTLAKLLEMSNVKPVGVEYIEMSNDGTKPVMYHCKLCDCKFNDPSAKDMHLKGRRHRLAYKKKVDPSLQVDMKASNSRTGRVARSPQGLPPPLQHFRNQPVKYANNVNRPSVRPPFNNNNFNQNQNSQNMRDNQFWNYPVNANQFGSSHQTHYSNKRFETDDDKYIMMKHQQIYPSDNMLHMIQQFVLATEKALKASSDILRTNSINNNEQNDLPISSNTPALNQAPLLGVARTEILSKGLLINTDQILSLIVLCASWPTKVLFNNIASMLQENFEEIWRDKIDVESDIENERIYVKSKDDFKLIISIVLTSPECESSLNLVSSHLANTSPSYLLSKKCCLDSLCALHSARWFQTRVSHLQHAAIIIRIFRYMTETSILWASLKYEVIELIVERILRGTHDQQQQQMTISSVFRLVLECLSSGLLLPDGPGLLDPCQKEPKNALDYLTVQQSEDITYAAQLALRMMAFEQLHKILDLEVLKSETNIDVGRKRPHPDDELAETANKKRMEASVV